MRAQTVNFERGLDPRDVLEIGNKNSRDFKKALREKDFLGPHLETMLDGLKEGSISEKEADQFVYGAISAFDKKFHLFWYDWFHDDPIIFWGSDVEKFIISFDLPEENDFWGYLTVRSEIFESKSSQYGKVFEMNTILQSKNTLDNTSDQHFPENMMFSMDDTEFKMTMIIKQMGTVIAASVKNMS